MDYTNTHTHENNHNQLPAAADSSNFLFLERMYGKLDGSSRYDALNSGRSEGEGLQAVHHPLSAFSSTQLRTSSASRADTVLFLSVILGCPSQKVRESPSPNIKASKIKIKIMAIVRRMVGHSSADSRI